MNSNGIISYGETGDKLGISIENADWGYSALNFYGYGGTQVGRFLYDSFGQLHLGGMSDVKLNFFGDIDFSNADSITWGSHAPIARFG